MFSECVSESRVVCVHSYVSVSVCVSLRVLVYLVCVFPSELVCVF